MEHKIPPNLKLVKEPSTLKCIRKYKQGGYTYVCGKKAVYTNGNGHYCNHHSLKNRFKIKTINPVLVHGINSYNMEGSKVIATFDTLEEAKEIYDGVNADICITKTKGPIHVKFKI